MEMTILRNRLLNIAALILFGFIAGNTLAAIEPIKEGGIGGTGTPAMHGGIGGTGLRPNDESTMPTLAGKVLFVVGPVEAQNLGQTRALAKGDAVRVGDKLKSGKGATVQLRMADGGTIVLRPESQLVIESFAYNGQQDGSEHMALALLSGGFRAVTGNIGHLHKENYSIRTPNATVGILGTDHETVFVGKALPGQTAVVEPGTYNHVISGATTLQSEQGKLRIEPNQTGFAALNGTHPIILDQPLPIFGDLKANSKGRVEQNDDGLNPGKDKKGGDGSSDSRPGKERSSLTETDRLANRSADQSTLEVSELSAVFGSAADGAQLTGESQTASSGLSEQNNLTQTDLIGNSSVDISTLETDASPAVSGSAVVGANLSLRAVGSAQIGNTGEKLLVEDGAPSAYSNDVTHFNYVDHQAIMMNPLGVGQVDGVNVNWGIYAGGIAFDGSGNAIAVDFHPFAFANGGATPLSVISSIGGTATFSNVVGSSTVTEQGKLGGSVALSVGVNLSAATVTSYNLGVTDGNSRIWTGTFSGSTPLSTFANGIPLTTTCSCSGTPSGSAAGILIGPNAGGLISSYVLTAGQAAVAGAVVIK
jgi:hypothetical protein